MDLDFNACIILVALVFISGLILVRCLLAVVNRGFLLVDYAYEKLYPEGRKAGGGKMGAMDIIGAIIQPILPEIGQAVKGALLGKGGPKQ